MAILTKRAPRSRFAARIAVPAGAAAAAVAVALVYPQVVSASTPTLPSKTPSQVIAEALSPNAKIYSGTVVQTSGLGLPTTLIDQISGGSTTSGLSGLLTQALASGVTSNFWTNYSSNLRIQVPSANNEFDVYASASGVWEWNSATNTATQVILPSNTSSSTSSTSTSAPTAPSPATIADNLLNNLPSGATVTLGTSQYVAGQAAYVLNLRPNDVTSLIGDVQVAVDGSTGNVLGVWIFPTNSNSAAFSVYYSSLSFSAPSSSVFDFTVPSGATTKTVNLTSSSSTSTSGSTTTTTTKPSVTHKTIGSGFSAVEVITGLPQLSTSSSSGLISTLLQSGTQVTTALGSGTVISTSVATIFVGTNGTLAFGAVPKTVLLGALELS